MHVASGWRKTGPCRNGGKGLVRGRWGLEVRGASDAPVRRQDALSKLLRTPCYGANAGLRFRNSDQRGALCHLIASD